MNTNSTDMSLSTKAKINLTAIILGVVAISVLATFFYLVANGSGV